MPARSTDPPDTSLPPHFGSPPFAFRMIVNGRKLVGHWCAADGVIWFEPFQRPSKETAATVEKKLELQWKATVQRLLLEEDFNVVSLRGLIPVGDALLFKWGKECGATLGPGEACRRAQQRYFQAQQWKEDKEDLSQREQKEVDHLKGYLES